MSQCIIWNVACSCKHRQSSGTWSCRIPCQTDYSFRLTELPLPVKVRVGRGVLVLLRNIFQTHTLTENCSSESPVCENTTLRNLGPNQVTNMLYIQFHWWCTNTSCCQWFLLHTNFNGIQSPLQCSTHIHTLTQCSAWGRRRGLCRLRDWNITQHILMQTQKAKKKREWCFSITHYEQPQLKAERQVSLQVLPKPLIGSDYHTQCFVGFWICSLKLNISRGEGGCYYFFVPIQQLVFLALSTDLFY